MNVIFVSNQTTVALFIVSIFHINPSSFLISLIKNLCQFQAAKRECDKVIDKNGPPPKGTGIKQLRENIAESKLSYEIMDDAAQAFLKTKIMDNIHKYFYLIVFSAYLREQAAIAKDGISDEEKKSFSLTSGKGKYVFFSHKACPTLFRDTILMHPWVHNIEITKGAQNYCCI